MLYVDQAGVSISSGAREHYQRGQQRKDHPFRITCGRSDRVAGILMFMRRTA
jgi:hypothetical protein